MTHITQTVSTTYLSTTPLWPYLTNRNSTTVKTAINENLQAPPLKYIQVKMRQRCFEGLTYRLVDDITRSAVLIITPLNPTIMLAARKLSIRRRTGFGKVDSLRIISWTNRFKNMPGIRRTVNSTRAPTLNLF